MAGNYTITVAEARGFSAVNADLDALAVIIAPSSLGSGFSSFFASGTAAVADRGYGDGVDTLCQIIEQPQASGSAIKMPAAMCTCAATTPGSYGAIDASLTIGTAVPMAIGIPRGTYEAQIKWITGTTALGTTGATYQYSLDGGRNWSTTKALGVGTEVVIPNSGVAIGYGAVTSALAALYTGINNLRTAAIGHYIITTGAPAVHGAADTADNVALTAIPAATTPATAVAAFNGILSTLIAHVATLVVHTTADAVATAALAALYPAVDTDDIELQLVPLRAAYEAHRVLVGAGPVHGSADATNTDAAFTQGALGTILAGDIVKVRTIAPQPVGADLDTAFTTLAMAPGDFAIVVLDFDMTVSLLGHVTTGLNALEATGKIVTCLARTRIPNAESSESDATWNASTAALYAALTDSRIVLRSAYGLQTDAMTSRRYLRSTLAQFAADVVRCPRAVWPCAPADQPESMVKLIDDSGTTIGHDEGPRGASTGLSNDTLGNRFSCETRLPIPSLREAVYNTVPWTLYAADEKIRNLMVRRVAQAMKRESLAVGASGLGGKIFYVPADPSVPGSLPRLTEASRNAVHGLIFGKLSVDFADDIQNASDGDVDKGLVQINSTVTVTGGNLIHISYTLAPLVLGYLLSLAGTLAVQE